MDPDENEKAREVLNECIQGVLRQLISPVTEVRDLKLNMSQDYVDGGGCYTAKGGVKYNLSFELLAPHIDVLFQNSKELEAKK